MKASPKIQKYMTPMPHTIGKDIPIKKSLEMMREYGIRHLPVQDGGHLVGIITDRDIKFASSFKGASDLLVEDVMTQDPYSTSPEALLEDVVKEMAEHKYGCAIVRQENGKIVGIFTEIDGLRVLSEMLKEHYAHR